VGRGSIVRHLSYGAAPSGATVHGSLHLSCWPQAPAGLGESGVPAASLTPGHGRGRPHTGTRVGWAACGMSPGRGAREPCAPASALGGPRAAGLGTSLGQPARLPARRRLRSSCLTTGAAPSRPGVWSVEADVWGWPLSKAGPGEHTRLCRGTYCAVAAVHGWRGGSVGGKLPRCPVPALVRWESREDSGTPGLPSSPGAPPGLRGAPPAWQGAGPLLAT
jgi:hypothetical protein